MSSVPDKSMPTTTYRIELVKQLRAEAKAAQLNLDGIPGVIAGGILHLAGLCDKAADEIERREEDRAYGEKQFALSATRRSILEEAAKVCKTIADGCDARADADGDDMRSHFWGGGARQCEKAIEAMASTDGKAA